MKRLWRRYWPALLAAATALVAVVVLLVLDWPFRREPPAEPARGTAEEANYSRIEDDLFMGGFVDSPPPGTRAVLNLCEQEDPYQAEVHRWDPIPDGSPAPELEWLRRQAEFVDRQRRAGLPVYVHCAAGISRSGLVVVAYLMQRDGLTRDQALAYVRARRPRVNPNPAFMALLLEWEAELRTRQRKSGDASGR
jgi:hypothetical protein